MPYHLMHLKRYYAVKDMKHEILKNWMIRHRNNKKKNDCYIHATFNKILNCSGICTRSFLSYLQWLEKVSAHTYFYISMKLSTSDFHNKIPNFYPRTKTLPKNVKFNIPCLN